MNEVKRVGGSIRPGTKVKCLIKTGWRKNHGAREKAPGRIFGDICTVVDIQYTEEDDLVYFELEEFGPDEVYEARYFVLLDRDELADVRHQNYRPMRLH
jgi:hypothetical protein